MDDEEPEFGVLAGGENALLIILLPILAGLLTGVTIVVFMLVWLL